jgi:Family of unknown function (DUF6504)
MLAIRDEPVEVVRRDDRPEQFLLRDRLYVVRGVLAHWVEPTARRWAAPALPRRQPAGPPAAVRSAPAEPVPTDRELWRVAAAAGRSAIPEYFDLCLSEQRPRWTATRLDEDGGS